MVKEGEMSEVSVVRPCSPSHHLTVGGTLKDFCHPGELLVMKKQPRPSREKWTNGD